MELKEIIEQNRIMILHEGKAKNGNLMNILVPFAQSDQKNSNGRIYPKALLQREINRVQEDINSGGFLGQSDHPKGGTTELGNVSHIVKKMWMDEGGRGWAELGILDTTKGRDLKSIILSGGRLGVSTRGFGTTDQDGKVKEDYKLANLDIVSNPSYKSGTFTQDSIFEAADLNKDKIMNKSKIVQPKDVFFEAQIAGISAKKMAEKINNNNEKVEISEHRKKLFHETLMACPEKSIEEINKIVDRTLVLESKITPAEKEEILSEEKTEKSKRRTRGNAQLVREAGGTADDMRRLNAYDERKVEKERERRNLITIIGRAGQIAGLGSEEVEKLVTAELKLAGLE